MRNLKRIISGVLAGITLFSLTSCSLVGNFQTDMQAQLDELNAKIEQQAQEIDGLKADNATLTETVEGLQADNATLTEEVNGLKADKEELNKTIAQMQEEKDAFFEALDTDEELSKAVDDLVYPYNAPYGVVCDLQTAYDYGVLTRDDLISIAYYQNSGRHHNEDIMSEDYTPQPKNSETMGDDVRRKIVETLKYDKGYQTIFAYYGCYNGIYAFYTGGGDNTLQIYYLEVDGIVFECGLGYGYFPKVFIPKILYPDIVAQIRNEKEIKNV